MENEEASGDDDNDDNDDDNDDDFGYDEKEDLLNSGGAWTTNEFKEVI